LVEAYEAKHFPIEAPDPIESIRFRMGQAGLTVKDLVPYLGRPNRVYEVLSRKRGLTIDMIRNLHKHLGIPADSLIGAWPVHGYVLPECRSARTVILS
jgi:HTH-type transcriptional regulator / antitoxin HigA